MDITSQYQNHVLAASLPLQKHIAIALSAELRQRLYQGLRQCCRSCRYTRGTQGASRISNFRMLEEANLVSGLQSGSTPQSQYWRTCGSPILPLSIPYDLQLPDCKCPRSRELRFSGQLELFRRSLVSRSTAPSGPAEAIVVLFWWVLGLDSCSAVCTPSSPAGCLIRRPWPSTDRLSFAAASGRFLHLTQCHHREMIDVAVIGAGPAGLASAAAILQVLGTKTTVQVCLSCTLSVMPSKRLLHLTHKDMHSLLNSEADVAVDVAHHTCSPVAW